MEPPWDFCLNNIYAVGSQFILLTIALNLFEFRQLVCTNSVSLFNKPKSLNS